MIDVKTNKVFTTRRMAIVGMLGAISMVLGMTPLGFIPIGPVNVTIMHLPVIIGAILEGPVVGAAVGLIFGLFSMIRAIMQPTPISFVFWNPIVSILPRILIGIVAFYSYDIAIKTIKNKTIASGLAGALGTLTNTIGVLGTIYLLYGAKFVETLGGDISQVGKFIIGIGMTNGIPEALVAVVVVGAVVKGLRAIKK